METLPIFIRDHADGQMLPWSRQLEAAGRFGVTLAQVEEVALERGILPARYQRNRKTLSVSDQLALFRGSVAVIGCGGLGGYVVEELARIGVGHLTIIDPDVFEEHNLNRQLYSTISNLGTPKVEAAQQRVREINPAVTVTAHRKSFSEANGSELLAGCGVAVDALDSIPARLALANTCSRLGKAMVHGSIAGWFGQVTTLLPGNNWLQDLSCTAAATKGIEQQQGNPSFTPALVASIEAAEACKQLLGTGRPLNSRTLMIDLYDMEMHELSHSQMEPDQT